MDSICRRQILLVDDDEGVRESLSDLLKTAGYEVNTAIHGFDGLLQMKTKVPEVLISDLNMPQMSGFELLSVVRRRFPDISVIAMSGAFHSGDAMPSGVIADAFFCKGKDDFHALLGVVADLVKTSAAHAAEHRRESAPVWIPRNGHDSRGIPYVVLTCTDCLRSFPLSVAHEDLQKIQETPCRFCSNTVRYVIDFSLSVVSPGTEKNGAATIIRAARAL